MIDRTIRLNFFVQSLKCVLETRYFYPKKSILSDLSMARYKLKLQKFIYASKI